MGRLEKLRTKLSRRPVDPERALRRAQAEARRRAARDDASARRLSGGGLGEGGGF